MSKNTKFAIPVMVTAVIAAAFFAMLVSASPASAAGDSDVDICADMPGMPGCADQDESSTVPDDGSGSSSSDPADDDPAGTPGGDTPTTNQQQDPQVIDSVNNQNNQAGPSVSVKQAPQSSTTSTAGTTSSVSGNPGGSDHSNSVGNQGLVQTGQVLQTESTVTSGQQAPVGQTASLCDKYPELCSTKDTAQVEVAASQAEPSKEAVAQVETESVPETVSQTEVVAKTETEVVKTDAEVPAKATAAQPTVADVTDTAAPSSVDNTAPSSTVTVTVVSDTLVSVRAPSPAAQSTGAATTDSQPVSEPTGSGSMVLVMVIAGIVAAGLMMIYVIRVRSTRNDRKASPGAPPVTTSGDPAPVGPDPVAVGPVLSAVPDADTKGEITFESIIGQLGDDFADSILLEDAKEIELQPVARVRDQA